MFLLLFNFNLKRSNSTAWSGGTPTSSLAGIVSGCLLTGFQAMNAFFKFYYFSFNRSDSNYLVWGTATPTLVIVPLRLGVRFWLRDIVINYIILINLIYEIERYRLKTAFQPNWLQAQLRDNYIGTQFKMDISVLISVSPQPREVMCNKANLFNIA